MYNLFIFVIESDDFFYDNKKNVYYNIIDCNYEKKNSLKIINQFKLKNKLTNLKKIVNLEILNINIISILSVSLFISILIICFFVKVKVGYNNNSTHNYNYKPPLTYIVGREHSFKTNDILKKKTNLVNKQDKLNKNNIEFKTFYSFYNFVSSYRKKINNYFGEHFSCNMELHANIPPNRNVIRQETDRSIFGGETTRSNTVTKFYSTPFIESQPGSVFTKKDLNINLKLNVDWDILLKKNFDFSNITTLQGGIKEKFSNQHSSIFGKFIFQIPLYDKLDNENGVDLYFNYKYKKNIQSGSVSGQLLHFLEIETKYYNLFNLVCSYIPTKNKLSVYMKIPFNDSIKKSLNNLDLKKIEKELNLKESGFNNKKLSFASTSTTNYLTSQSNVNELEIIHESLVNSLKQKQILNEGIKKKIKYNIEILKNKNKTKFQKKKAYSNLMKLLENQYNSEKSRNFNTEFTSFQLIIIRLMDVLIAISLAAIIGGYLPKAHYNLRNPFLFLCTLFISLFTRLFLDGTVEKTLSETVAVSVNSSIEKVIKNNFLISILFQILLVSLLVYIIIFAIYRILLLIEKIKGLNLFNLLNGDDLDNPFNFDTLNPTEPGNPGGSTSNEIISVEHNSVNSFADKTIKISRPIKLKKKTLTRLNQSKFTNPFKFFN